MESSIKTLRGFVQTIMNNERDFQSLHGPILYYGLFLRNVLKSIQPSFVNQRNTNLSAYTEMGEALTPWHAAACMEDRTRTAAFIRGSISAVEKVLELSSHRPLHLVEAGCGPLGTLILPLLAYFSSDELEVSVIDIHQESIDCMSLLFDHFGFARRVRQIVCEDATRFDFDTPADIVLTETMNAALGREPQVAITLALMKSNPTAMLIPQSITITLELIDAKEELSHFPPQVGERISLGTVFVLNSKTALILEETDGRLTASSIEIPEESLTNLVLSLTTKVQIFEDSQIRDYETQITHPKSLEYIGDATISLGDTLQFSYRLGSPPGFICDKVSI